MTPSALSNERLDEMRTALTAPNVGMAVLTGADLRDTISALTELLSYRSEGVKDDDTREIELNLKSRQRMAFRVALADLPEIAPPEVRSLLSSVHMQDEFMREGKRLQIEHGTDAVAPRVEQECGAGAWSFMRQGVLRALSPSTERAQTIEGWQPIETAVRSIKERDILLFARFEDQGGGYIEDIRVGRWVSCTGPNGLIDGWESDEGVHPEGYFSLWMPLPDPPRALNPRDWGRTMSDRCEHCRSGWFHDQRFGQDVECVNGVLIDIDEAREGWQPDVAYPVAPCHPMWPRQVAGDEDFPNDCQERLGSWAQAGEDPS